MNSEKVDQRGVECLWRLPEHTVPDLGEDGQARAGGRRRDLVREAQRRQDVLLAGDDMDRTDDATQASEGVDPIAASLWRANMAAV